MVTTEEFLKSMGVTMSQREPTVEDVLKHHGVKGMRWGVRKNRSSSVVDTLNNNAIMMSPNPKKARKTLQEAQKARAADSGKPKAHELSDEELKKAIERMNLEKQYHALVNPPPPPKKESEASKFIKDMGKGLAKDLIKTGLNSQVSKMVAKKP